MTQASAERIARELQLGLLQEVSPAVRCVGFELAEDALHLYFYYDGEISDDDLESASVVETEIIAALPDDVRVISHIKRLDAPAELPRLANWVYARREASVTSKD